MNLKRVHILENICITNDFSSTSNSFECIFYYMTHQTCRLPADTTAIRASLTVIYFKSEVLGKIK